MAKPAASKRLVVIVALIIGCWLLKNALVKMAVIGGAKAITGLNVHVSRMDLGLLKTSVGIQGLRVGNPPGFTEPVMVDLPEIYVDYRLGSLLSGKPHFDVVRLHLDTLTVEKNAQGQINLNSIKALQQAPPQKPAGPAAPKAPAPAFVIDRLQLKIGRVVYKDFSKGGAPQTRDFAVNIDEEFKHVTNPYTFAGLIVSRALMKTTLSQLGALGDIDVKALQADVTNALKASAADLLPTAEAMGRTAEDVSKKALGTANESVEKASDAVSEAAGAFKKLLNQP